MHELAISVVKTREVSNGVTVSRLHSGDFALAVHDGDRRVMLDLTPEELHQFAVRLLEMTRSVRSPG